MNGNDEIVRQTLQEALAGRAAHAPVGDIFDGLTWKLAGERPQGVSHAIYQQVNHLVYWQDFGLRWLDGDKPATPEHAAESWPGDEAPADQQAWESAVERFKSGLAEIVRRAVESNLYEQLGPKTALDILQVLASHNSYHAGQVAALRRALGAWPPPGGGATW
jgi:uncharacterized damage-inducible protein DinB